MPEVKTAAISLDADEQSEAVDIVRKLLAAYDGGSEWDEIGEAMMPVAHHARLWLLRLDRYPPEVAERLGKSGTVIWAVSHPEARVLVDLDVGGLYHVERDQLEPVEVS